MRLKDNSRSQDRKRIDAELVQNALDRTQKLEWFKKTTEGVNDTFEKAKKNKVTSTLKCVEM